MILVLKLLPKNKHTIGNECLICEHVNSGETIIIIHDMCIFPFDWLAAFAIYIAFSDQWSHTVSHWSSLVLLSIHSTFYDIALNKKIRICVSLWNFPYFLHRMKRIFYVSSNSCKYAAAKHTILRILNVVDHSKAGVIDAYDWKMQQIHRCINAGFRHVWMERSRGKLLLKVLNRTGNDPFSPWESAREPREPCRILVWRILFQSISQHLPFENDENFIKVLRLKKIEKPVSVVVFPLGTHESISFVTPWLSADDL